MTITSPLKFLFVSNQGAFNVVVELRDHNLPTSQTDRQTDVMLVAYKRVILHSMTH